MTYAIDANGKQAAEVLLFIFKYSPDLHKKFLEGLSRLSNLDVDENGANRGRDGLCCSSYQNLTAPQKQLRSIVRAFSSLHGLWEGWNSAFLQPPLRSDAQMQH